MKRSAVKVVDCKKDQIILGAFALLAGLAAMILFFSTPEMKTSFFSITGTLYIQNNSFYLS